LRKLICPLNACLLQMLHAEGVKGNENLRGTAAQEEQHK